MADSPLKRKISSWELAAPGQQHFDHLEGQIEADEEEFPELSSGRPLIRLYETRATEGTLDDEEDHPLIAQSRPGALDRCASLIFVGPTSFTV
jgi:hypothetical protein